MDAHPRRRRPRTSEEAAATLRKAWCRLRLSARDPARVPPWDAVVLTAASPQQAALYNRQLERARALGRFPASTAAIAVPDSDGARIGSGAHVVEEDLKIDGDLRDLGDLKICVRSHGNFRPTRE